MHFVIFSGDILACLVNSLAPGLVPDFAEMNPENNRENIDRSMAMALEWMDIPRVLEPEDMMDPNVRIVVFTQYVVSRFAIMLKEIRFVIMRMFPPSIFIII